MAVFVIVQNVCLITLNSTIVIDEWLNYHVSVLNSQKFFASVVYEFIFLINYNKQFNCIILINIDK